MPVLVVDTFEAIFTGFAHACPDDERWVAVRYRSRTDMLNPARLSVGPGAWSRNLHVVSDHALKDCAAARAIAVATLSCFNGDKDLARFLCPSGPCPSSSGALLQSSLEF